MTLARLVMSMSLACLLLAPAIGRADDEGLRGTTTRIQGTNKFVGILSPENPRMGGDGSPFQGYSYSADAGETITVTLFANAFTPYLRVGRAEDGAFKTYAWGAGQYPGDTAKLTVKLSEAGTYVIIVSARQQDPKGVYTLNIEAIPGPLPQVLAPRTAEADALRWSELKVSRARLYDVWGPDERTVYVAGEDGVHLSEDGGVTWRLALSTLQPLRGVWGSGRSDVYVVGASIRRSTDGGRTWPHVAASERAKIPRVTFSDVWAFGDHVYVAGSAGEMLQSADRGATWTRKSFQGAALTSVWGDNETVFVSDAKGRIFTSRDAGQTWGAPYESAQPGETLVWGTAAEAFAAQTVAMLRGGAAGTWASTDAPGKDVSAMWGTSAKDFFCAVDSGLLLHTRDGGKTWNATAKAQSVNAIWGSSANDVYAVGSGTVLHGRTPAGVASALHAPMAPPAPAAPVVPSSLAPAIAGAASDALRWSELDPSDTSAGAKGVWGSGNGIVYVAGVEGILLSEDGGATWQISLPSGASTRNNGWAAVWGTGKDDVYAVGLSDIEHSADGGRTWQRMAPEIMPLKSFVAVGGIGNHVYAAGRTGSFVHSADRGATWAPVATDLRVSGPLWVSAAAVCVAVDAGALGCSRDQGKSWQRVETGITDDLAGVWGSGDDLFVAGGDRVAHRVGAGDWEEVSSPGKAIRGIWGTSPTDFFCLIEGGSKLVHTRDGGKSWKEEGAHSYHGFKAIWGSSAGDVYAVSKGQLAHGVPANRPPTPPATPAAAAPVEMVALTRPVAEVSKSAAAAKDSVLDAALKVGMALFLDERACRDGTIPPGCLRAGLVLIEGRVYPKDTLLGMAFLKEGCRLEHGPACEEFKRRAATGLKAGPLASPTRE